MRSKKYPSRVLLNQISRSICACPLAFLHCPQSPSFFLAGGLFTRTRSSGIFYLFGQLLENKELLSASTNVSTPFSIWKILESLKNLVINFSNTCHCCNKAVLVSNHPVIFGGKGNEEREVLNMLQFLIAKKIKYDDIMPKTFANHA